MFMLVVERKAPFLGSLESLLLIERLNHQRAVRLRMTVGAPHFQRHCARAARASTRGGVGQHCTFGRLRVLRVHDIPAILPKTTRKIAMALKPGERIRSRKELDAEEAKGKAEMAALRARAEAKQAELRAKFRDQELAREAAEEERERKRDLKAELDQALEREQELKRQLARQTSGTPEPPIPRAVPVSLQVPEPEGCASTVAAFFIVASLLLSLGSLMVFPPVLGLLAFVCAIGAAAFGAKETGAALMLVAIGCACAGMYLGAQAGAEAGRKILDQLGLPR